MLRTSDIAWAIRTLFFRLVWNIVPIGLHLRFAELQGWHRQRQIIPKHVLRNMDSVFSNQYDSRKINQIAREYIAFSSKERYLSRVLPNLANLKGSRCLTIQGLEHLNDALKLGRGALLVTSHFGYAGVAAAILSHSGLEVKRVMAKSPYSERIRRWVDWLDAGGFLRKRVLKAILQPILTTTSVTAQLALRSIVSALSNNAVVLIAGDGLRETRFFVDNLLGKPYPFSTGFSRIAEMTGAVVLPTFATDQDKYRIVVDIHRPTTSIPEKGSFATVREYARILGSAMEERPHLWRRWQTPRVFESVRMWMDEEFSERLDQSFGRWALQQEDE